MLETALIVLLVVSIFCCAVSCRGGNRTATKGEPLPMTVVQEEQQRAPAVQANNMEEIKQEMTAKYRNRVPLEWGEKVTGVVTALAAAGQAIALTFDACGGPSGSGFDRDLIDFLTKERIPATLFISGRWIDANPGAFQELAENSLFEIGNHGLLHRPLSVNGKSAYRIGGTGSIAEVVEEVEGNARKIAEITGRKPRLYRPGTAYCDEIAVMVVKDLGYAAVNFNVIGDAGATFGVEQIKAACRSAKPGSIILFHMNHPEGFTAEGVKEGIKELRARGYRFVKAGDYLEK